LIINGSVGDLEVLVNIPVDCTSIAVVCHPHPLYGGTMNNKVVYMIAKTFNSLSIGTVRFNFRGVGKSSGKYDKGIGETEDLHAIVNWLTEKYAPKKLYLAGFSFGSYVVLRAFRDMKVSRLLLVAPSIDRFEMAGLELTDIPTLVIQGDQDEIVSPKAVSEWLAAQTYPAEIVMLPDTSHFFHGKLHELRDTIIKFWAIYK
jgi:alpha/beta superfamily hydrolase